MRQDVEVSACAGCSKSFRTFLLFMYARLLVQPARSSNELTSHFSPFSSCVLVRPTNFTAGLAAHVDCSIQVGSQTQLVFQTFCQCLKTAMGTDRYARPSILTQPPHSPKDFALKHLSSASVNIQALKHFLYSQFLNCDVYGSPLSPGSNNTATSTSTEAPAEFFDWFNF